MYSVEYSAAFKNNEVDLYALLYNKMQNNGTVFTIQYEHTKQIYIFYTYMYACKYIENSRRIVVNFRKRNWWLNNGECLLYLYLKNMITRRLHTCIAGVIKINSLSSS